MTGSVDNAAAAAAEDFLVRIAGQTVPSLLERNAVEFGDRAAITSAPDANGDTSTLTWTKLRERAAEFSEGLVALGLEPGDRMLTMMSSRLEHWIADHGAQHARAIPCTAYATLSTEQIGFVAAHSAAPIVVLEGRHEIERWQPILAGLPALRHVIVVEEADCVVTGEDAHGKQFLPYSAVLAIGRERLADNPSLFEQRWKQIRPEDPVGMMYTSGTTGDPKGVVLTHLNVLYEAVVVDAITSIEDFPDTIAYLPLAHIAERELSLYGSVMKTAHVHLCPDPRQVVGALGRVHPAGLFGVPRIWEKLAAGVQGLVKGAEPAQREAFEKAHAVTLEAAELEAAGKQVPEELARAVEEADRTVLAPTRSLLGLDRVTRATSGAAPISVETLRFLHGLGVPLMEVWGMSETSGAATVCTPDANRVGTVGKPIPGVELKIGEAGEVFARGPIMLAGYLQPDGSVLSPLDDEGWLATGDVGTLDADGFLTITDRKKELIITSGGKNIAPTLIESHLTAHPAIGFAVAIGDRRPYVTALIVLDPDVFSADAAHSAEARAAVDRAVATANAKLSRVEQVKKYTIVPGPWTPDTGEVTPKLSLRRRVIAERYAGVIDEMYLAPPADGEEEIHA
ncbi:AMP-dependent synthetase and ligase [Catenulispora acidiphila DSM 44928]|uniref:Acyl-CoA synthetase n=1 Tax=Catenulispora acidiphila (strain DSM 44928 / JCM 14897 / NBRC 102108 / NRRL B-24433 / ID139908) TaxID=479433 RepID=C7Q9M0_CATAD|nr:AMP-dependent synthetase/ligase [Catenulispora acidiphila]ACU76189.1 AMP-dependent synthetase and ligase [Catenulispora acidiphila DSM 44928]